MGATRGLGSRHGLTWVATERNKCRSERAIYNEWVMSSRSMKVAAQTTSNVHHLRPITGTPA